MINLKIRNFNSDAISSLLFCSLWSAVILSLVSVFSLGIVSLSALDAMLALFLMFFFVFFMIYLFVALPVQIKLNQRPKKFDLSKLAIYGLFAGLVIIVYMRFFGDYENPLVISDFYLVWAFATVPFWILDSILAQEKDR